MARRSAENAIDWDLIEREYRLGQKTNKQLASEHGVSASQIGRRASKYGWVVDKSQEVAVATNALLIQNASGNANPNATPTQAEIQVAAQTNVEVVLAHRKGLARLRDLRDKLIVEVEIVTDNQELFEQLGELLDKTDEDPETGRVKVDKLNQLYRKVITVSERIENTKKLAEIDEKVRKGEREAFGLDKDHQTTSLDEIIKSLDDERRKAGGD